MATKSPVGGIAAITGGQDLFRRRALQATIQTQEKGGWRIEHVEGSKTSDLRACLSAGGGFFENNHVLVVVENPDKADLSIFEQHLAEGDPDVMLLLYYPKDPKKTSKFGKFLTKLGRFHRDYPELTKSWEAEEAAVKFCVEEARRHEKVLDPTHATLIVERAGSNLGVLSFEILKMSLLANVEGSSTLTPQIIGGGLAQLMEASLKPLIEALAVKNKAKLCKVLTRIQKTSKEDPTLKVCRWLGYSALEWLSAIDLRDKGVTADEAAVRLNLNPYYYKNHVLSKIRSWKMPEISSLVRALAESERAVFNGYLNPWVGLEARLLQVLEGQVIGHSPSPVTPLIFFPVASAPLGAPVVSSVSPVVSTPPSISAPLTMLEVMSAAETTPPKIPIPVQMKDFKFDPADPFLSASSDPRQFLAPQFPIPFIVPPDVWQRCCDFKDQVLELRRKSYEGRGDGGNVSPRDLVGGKAAEVILAGLLQHLGFPKCDPSFAVQLDPTYDPDLQYSKDSGFPDVHVKASGMPDFTGGTFQFLGNTDYVFRPIKGTKTELREHYVTHTEASGESWEFHPGKSVLGELVALLKYTQIPSLIRDYNPQKPPLIHFYAMFPFHYLFDHPLLQPRLDRNPTKLAFYYETLMYFQGRSTQVYIPGRGLVG